MGTEYFAVTSNRLEIPNPNRLHGTLQVLLGLALGGLVGLRWPRAQEALEAFQRRGSMDGPEAVLAGGVLLATGVAALYALVVLLAGLRNLLTFFVPTGVPGALNGSPDAAYGVLNDLFVNRVIKTFEAPSLGLRLAAKLFSPRLQYAYLRPRVLIGKLWGSLFKWGLLVAVCSAPLFLSPEDLRRLHVNVQKLGEYAPPYLLYATALVCLAAQAVAVALAIPNVPDVRVQESSAHQDQSGNPVNFFNHTLEQFQALRRGDFPNRELLKQEPQMPRLNQGQTDSFDAHLMVETQPLPLPGAYRGAALVLGAAGAALVCCGLAALMFLPELLPGSGPLVGQVVPLAIGGLVALLAGMALRAESWRLYNTFAFHSDAFWVQMKGTYTASQVGLGDGRGGQLFTKRVAVQSDTYLRIWGTRIITACSPLEGTRILVDSLLTDEFSQRLETLKRAALNFVDTGGNLAGINPQSGGVNQIVEHNIRLQAAMAAAANAARALPGSQTDTPLELPAPAPKPEEAGDGSYKVCPECGEKIRAAARKCRFCNYRFEARQ